MAKANLSSIEKIAEDELILALHSIPDAVIERGKEFEAMRRLEQKGQVQTFKQWRSGCEIWMCRLTHGGKVRALELVVSELKREISYLKRLAK